MIPKCKHRRRRGAVMVEASLAYSAAILLSLGTISIGLGIFRYEQIAYLAREGARWASVHGSKYQSEQGQAAPTSSDVLANAITPKLVALDSTKLTCTLSMTSGTATVTLSYQWTPEVFAAPVTFTSKSVQPILY